MKKESEIKYKKQVPIASSEEKQKRVFKPRIDLKLCEKCMLCVVFCPDSCIEISSTGNPTVNYNCCKGCLICLRECPYGAIAEERE